MCFPLGKVQWYIIIYDFPNMRKIRWKVRYLCTFLGSNGILYVPACTPLPSTHTHSSFYIHTQRHPLIFNSTFICYFHEIFTKLFKVLWDRENLKSPNLEITYSTISDSDAKKIEINNKKKEIELLGTLSNTLLNNLGIKEKKIKITTPL